MENSAGKCRTRVHGNDAADLSYYFLYMIAFFAVFYVFIYSIMQRYSLKRTAGKVAGLGGMGILGVLIGGVALVPIADTFLGECQGRGTGCKRNFSFTESI